MNDLITGHEANKILSKGYATDEQLVRFPLGEVLSKIPKVDPRYGDHTSGHICRAMEGVNYLLEADGKQAHHIVKQWRDHYDPTRQEARLFAESIAGIRQNCVSFGEIDEFNAFFRLLAVYHDIGKSVILPRHPTVGFHLIKEVFREKVETQLYPLLLGLDYDEWEKRKRENGWVLDDREKRRIKIFEDVLRYHDLFGTLSTGEASTLVMVDLISLLGTPPMEAKELLSILMLFNLADLYGSVDQVYPYKVQYFCKDLKFLCGKIEEAEGNRKHFFERLLSAEQTQERSLKRIGRLLKEDAPEKWRDGKEIDEMLERCFRQACLGTMNTFYKHFAVFCKLDYALKFKKQLMNCASRESLPLGKTLNTILWLLVQVQRQYGDACELPDGALRRIGVDFSGLTRTEEIGATICDLIMLQDTGKEWAIGECGIWFMDE